MELAQQPWSLAMISTCSSLIPLMAFSPMFFEPLQVHGSGGMRYQVRPFKSGGDNLTATVSTGGTVDLFALHQTGLIFQNILNVGMGGVVDFWTGWFEVPATGPRGIGTHGLAATGFLLIHRDSRGRQRIKSLFGDFRLDPWVPLPTGPTIARVTTHGPAATSTGDTAFVYIRGQDASIYQIIFDEAFSTTGWDQVVGLNATAAPGAAVTADGRVLLVARGIGGRIFKNLGPVDGQWSEVPGQLHDAATAAPAVVSYQGRNLVFVSGTAASGIGDRMLCTEVVQ
jgi:hypothetical protein